MASQEGQKRCTCQDKKGCVANCEHCKDCRKGNNCSEQCCKRKDRERMTILLVLMGIALFFIVFTPIMCHMTQKRMWPFHKLHDYLYSLPDIYDPYERYPPEGTY